MNASASLPLSASAPSGVPAAPVSGPTEQPPRSLQLSDRPQPRRPHQGPPTGGARTHPAPPVPTMEPAAETAMADTAVATDQVTWYLQLIGRTPLLSQPEEVALAQRAQQGDTVAAEALALANLRLVVSVARRYRQRGLPLDDLIAEGNLGLLHAVQKYDWQRGYRFSTYAVGWIRQAITRALANHGHTVRVPVHVGDTLARQARLRQRLADDLGREPTGEEWAQDERARGLAHEAAAIAALQPPLSLDLPVGDTGNEHLVDFVPDEQAVLPEEGALQRLLTQETHQILAEVLTERQRAVLTLRFGLDGGTPQTLDVVGQRLGITRERVRQIEGEAVRRVRHALLLAHWRAS